MKKTILVDAWNTFVTSEGINKNLFQLLEDYNEKKIIVTNANIFEKEKFGIINMPYPVFSLNHKPNKTNPIYFETLMDNYNLDSEDLIYLEHNIDAINSAKSLGIKSHHYKSKEPISYLKSFLKDNC